MSVKKKQKETRYITPEFITREDIVRTRKMLGLTQKEFAKLVGTSTSTVERWEAGDKEIRGAICLAVFMLQNQCINAEDFEIPPKKFPVRLWYMCGNIRCTLIDVDESKEIVKIKNYVSDITKRAFGRNLEPTFEEYEEFLKSRIFPETRSDINAVLEDIDLPFYDPFLIIKKTRGKMSEDNFWIEIEG